MSILEEVNQVVQVPMKFIHITRNPFDNIATMMLRRVRARDDVREAGVKVSLINCLIGLLWLVHVSFVTMDHMAQVLL